MDRQTQSGTTHDAAQWSDTEHSQIATFLPLPPFAFAV